MVKCVRWSTVTIYEFGVTLGGSAIPKHGGPSIGLARKPSLIWSTTIDEIDSNDEYNLEETICGKRKRNIYTSSTLVPEKTKKRVRWLKPIERVTLLTKAGCSKKRIYKMMEESSHIAMSRRLCISIQKEAIKQQTLVTR